MTVNVKKTVAARPNHRVSLENHMSLGLKYDGSYIRHLECVHGICICDDLLSYRPPMDRLGQMKCRA